jgi:hypothetical protein
VDLAPFEEPARHPVLVPSARQQAPRTGARFGVGLNLATAPGGIAPTLLFEPTPGLALKASAGLLGGFTALQGEVLVTFPPDDSESDTLIEPYVGGGFLRLSVDYGMLGVRTREAFTGLTASGGAFITLEDQEHFKLSADVTYIRIDLDGYAIAGLGFRTGIHYMF